MLTWSNVKGMFLFKQVRENLMSTAQSRGKLKALKLKHFAINAYFLGIR